MSVKIENPVAQLEAARKRLDQVVSRRTQVQVQLEAARQQYAEAVKEAEQAYGTADLSELKRRLMDAERQNEQLVADFVRAVDEFDRYITQLEQALTDPAVLAELLAAMPATEPAPAASSTTTVAPAAGHDDDDI